MKSDVRGRTRQATKRGSLPKTSEQHHASSEFDTFSPESPYTARINNKTLFEWTLDGKRLQDSKFNFIKTQPKFGFSRKPSVLNPFISVTLNTS